MSQATAVILVSIAGIVAVFASLWISARGKRRLAEMNADSDAFEDAWAKACARGDHKECQRLIIVGWRDFRKREGKA